MQSVLLIVYNVLLLGVVAKHEQTNIADPYNCHKSPLKCIETY